MDPLAAIAVGMIILRICFQMVKGSILKLMDKAPEGILNEIRQALATVKNIAGIKDVNAREVGREMEFEIALHVPEDITVSQGEKIKSEARRAVRKTVERKSTVKVRLLPVSSEA